MQTAKQSVHTQTFYLGHYLIIYYDFASTSIWARFRCTTSIEKKPLYLVVRGYRKKEGGSSTQTQGIYLKQYKQPYRHLSCN